MKEKLKREGRELERWGEKKEKEKGNVGGGSRLCPSCSFFFNVVTLSPPSKNFVLEN